MSLILLQPVSKLSVQGLTPLPVPTPLLLCPLSIQVCWTHAETQLGRISSIFQEISPPHLCSLACAVPTAQLGCGATVPRSPLAVTCSVVLWLVQV